MCVDTWYMDITVHMQCVKPWYHKADGYRKTRIFCCQNISFVKCLRDLIFVLGSNAQYQLIQLLFVCAGFRALRIVQKLMRRKIFVFYGMWAMLMSLYCLWCLVVTCTNMKLSCAVLFCTERSYLSQSSCWNSDCIVLEISGMYSYLWLKNIPHSLTHCFSRSHNYSYYNYMFVVHYTVSHVVRITVLQYFYDSTKQWWHIDALWCQTVACIIIWCYAALSVQEGAILVSIIITNNDYRAWDNNALSNNEW